VCIVCRNEADRLGPCLDSVVWADEIIVLDLSSTDGSGALAAARGARVIRREPLPIVELLRNEVAAAAACEWILALDPDERVTPGLARELRRLASRADLDAVVIPRMNVDFGHPPSHPIHRYEPQLRMYRRSRVRWPSTPNRLPVVPGDRLYRIPPADEVVLVHDRSRNVPEVLERSIRYAPAEARAMLERGEVFTARAMLAGLASAVNKQFIQAQPWRDGVPGMLRASVLVAFKFYIWAAFWQLSGARRTTADDRLIWRIGLLLRAVGLVSRVCGAASRLVGARWPSR
jgi:glycosyltransferase involved in cell wall biosynthesis